MNKSSKVKGALEVLLVIGLILVIPLFFAIKTQADPQVAQNTVTPTILPAAPPSTPAALRATAQQPPQCTFPLAQTATTESTPEEYTFSEPQVVLTAPQGNIYHIVEWLPDSQQILMTEELGNDSDGLESIRLYNPETGESKVYAIRPITYQSPAWQPELNAVVYPIMKYFDVDKQNRTYKFTRQLWVSYGDPETAQMLSDNPSQLPFAIKPGGSDMLYLSDKEISKLDKSLKKPSSAPFDSVQWDYAKERRSDKSVSYNMAWQPGTSLIFLYSEGAMQGGGYTFILDADTGQVCELDLGGWAKVARWSSDGHYLAFIRVKDYAFLYPRSELALLDTATGNLIIFNVTPQEIAGQHYVKGFTWAPDNRHLLAIGEIYTSLDNQSETGLYLVDFVSGQSVRVVPENKGFVFSHDNNFAWSPDGSKVVIHCPTKTVDQICLIPVQRTGQ